MLPQKQAKPIKKKPYTKQQTPGYQFNTRVHKFLDFQKKIQLKNISQEKGCIFVNDHHLSLALNFYQKWFFSTTAVLKLN